jgi:hypothetical protein
MCPITLDVSDCTFFAAQFLFMHKMEPFDSKHIEEYLGHNQHQRHFEILFLSAIARYFLDPCNQVTGKTRLKGEHFGSRERDTNGSGA